MRGRKHLSKKNQQKTAMPKNNQCLLNFVKVEKPNQEIQKVKEPKINIPKKIKIPNSSGQTSSSYPQNPQILYPKNPEFRDYQFQISMECIKCNTLVCLPTGLGKTHVASILIMNFTLWFPESKIFFLAPTRPLVRQQRQSLKWFYQKIGVQNVFEMNGQITGQKRKKYYAQKKVFFATPQTFANDLKEGRINKEEIKLVIFDQAHRAVGNSAYAESIRFLNKQAKSVPRIIGLSATPGNQKDKIQEVINNLNIAKMMYKDEEQPDVKKYFFNRSVIPIIIDPPSIIQETLNILDEMVIPYLRYIISLKLADSWIIKSKINSGLFYVVFQSFNQRKSQLDPSNSQFAYSSLKVIKFLIDSKTDLISHGYETFKSKFFRHIENIVLQETQQNIQQKQKGQQSRMSKNSKTSKNSHSVKLLNQNLPKKFKQKTIQSQGYKRIKELFNPKSNVLNHPKLQKLRQILDQFFKSAFRRFPSGKFYETENELKVSSSKVIVFTHYRSTAFQIKSYLSKSQIIRSELFHGQSKTQIFEDRYNDMGEYENSKQSTLVLNQKQQISIIDKFKKGDINTLIATSIGQQGLDIGEVDCIVCYDGGNKSPIRSIQRFGRTGRKRDGIVYVLLMKGTEQNDYKKGQEKIKSMKKMLKQGEFIYYGFNVSLLKEQSQVPIVLYDNQILQAPKTQKKQNRGRKRKEKLKEQSESSSQTEEKQEQQISKCQILQKQQKPQVKINGAKLSNSDFLEDLFQKDLQETCYIQHPQICQNFPGEIQSKSLNEIQKVNQKEKSIDKQVKKQKSTKKRGSSKRKRQQKKNKQIQINPNKDQCFEEAFKIIQNTQQKRKKSSKSKSKKSQSKSLSKKSKQKVKKQQGSNTLDNEQMVEKPQQLTQISNVFQVQKSQPIQKDIQYLKKTFQGVNETVQKQIVFSCKKKDKDQFYQKHAKSYTELGDNLIKYFQSSFKPEQRMDYQYEKNNKSLSFDESKNFLDEKLKYNLVEQDLTKNERKKLDLMLEQFFQQQQGQQCPLEQQNQNKLQKSKGNQKQQNFQAQQQEKNRNIHTNSEEDKYLLDKRKLLAELFSSDSQDQNGSLNSSQILDEIIAHNSNKTCFDSN